LIAFFQQYKIRVPLTEEFVESTFTDIDADGDGFVDLKELKDYLDQFLQTLIDMFTQVLNEHPQKMIRIESFSVAELEAIRDHLMALEKDKAQLKQEAYTYFAEFDVDKSGTLEKGELTNLVKEFFARRQLAIPFDKNFIDAVFLDLDVDGSGKIEVGELVEMFEQFNTMLYRMYVSAVDQRRKMK
jgi:Ca2+-binding EF-hand superfamily protein